MFISGNMPATWGSMYVIKTGRGVLVYIDCGRVAGHGYKGCALFKRGGNCIAKIKMVI